MPYTRFIKYRHLTGQPHPRTSITRVRTDSGDPYPLIPAPENAALRWHDEALAEQTRGVTFSGRLGINRSYNLDLVATPSLALFHRIAQDSSVMA